VLGDKVIGGTVTVNVAVVTVPPVVVTLTVLAPTFAFVGTLKLVDQLPESLTVISDVFQGVSLNFMPPTLIVS
jgi:hypothetical protein